MTYRIEITAPTLAELGGKLAAAASQFMSAGASTREITIRVPAVAAEPAPTPTIDVVLEPAPGPVSEPAPADAPGSRTYDYATEVAPRVLELVAKRSRDGAKAVLATLGVTSASKLPPSRYGELLIVIDAALKETR